MEREAFRIHRDSAAGATAGFNDLKETDIQVVAKNKLTVTECAAFIFFHVNHYDPLWLIFFRQELGTAKRSTHLLLLLETVGTAITPIGCKT